MKKNRNKGLHSLSYMAFQSGKYNLAARIARIDMKNADITRSLQYVASLRMAGLLKEALDNLNKTEDSFVEEIHSDASLEARACFEKAMCLRWLGKEAEALTIINEMDENRLRHASLNWTGWLHFEKGTCLSLRNKWADAENEAIAAKELFEITKLINGELNTLALLCTIYRFKNNDRHAFEIIDEAFKKLKEYKAPSFLRETLEFEKAEILRQEKKFDIAEASYLNLIGSRSILHKCHGSLGMAELARDIGKNNEVEKWAYRAKEGYKRIGCKWGECNAILTLVLNGSIGQEKGLEEAKKIYCLDNHFRSLDSVKKFVDSVKKFVSTI